jgi:hypothetical protein
MLSEIKAPSRPRRGEHSALKRALRPALQALAALCIYENLVARRELPADGLPPPGA